MQTVILLHNYWFPNSVFFATKIAAQLMGFPRYIPPYSRARGPQLLQGVNYASGASGIRDETGDNLVNQ